MTTADLERELFSEPTMSSDQANDFTEDQIAYLLGDESANTSEQTSSKSTPQSGNHPMEEDAINQPGNEFHANTLLTDSDEPSIMEPNEGNHNPFQNFLNNNEGLSIYQSAAEDLEFNKESNSVDAAEIVVVNTQQKAEKPRPRFNRLSQQMFRAYLEDMKKRDPANIITQRQREELVNIRHGLNHLELHQNALEKKFAEKLKEQQDHYKEKLAIEHNKVQLLRRQLEQILRQNGGNQARYNGRERWHQQRIYPVFHNGRRAGIRTNPRGTYARKEQFAARNVVHEIQHYNIPDNCEKRVIPTVPHQPPVNFSEPVLPAATHRLQNFPTPSVQASQVATPVQAPKNFATSNQTHPPKDLAAAILPLLEDTIQQPMPVLQPALPPQQQEKQITQASESPANSLPTRIAVTVPLNVTSQPQNVDSTYDMRPVREYPPGTLKALTLNGTDKLNIIIHSEYFDFIISKKLHGVIKFNLSEGQITKPGVNVRIYYWIESFHDSWIHSQSARISGNGTKFSISFVPQQKLYSGDRISLFAYAFIDQTTKYVSKQIIYKLRRPVNGEPAFTIVE